ncbi:hypothetical protein PMZ80_008694 [Knufia obscura]|uniref:Uncharacterized protein n=1 Tax=Knufia obscura TaxID=1635080 RepID=A0ABR0RFN6_9EURO|nr:hypothetical protein PMZ80_008694 [Knufia obscura]
MMVGLPSERGKCSVVLGLEGNHKSTQLSVAEELFGTASLWFHGVTATTFHKGDVFIALLYNLVIDDMSLPPSINSVPDRAARLRQMFHTWAKQSGAESSQPIIHKCSRHYQSKDLQPLNLEPQDRKLFTLLQQACAGTECSLYLISTERCLEGRREASHGQGPGNAPPRLAFTEKDTTAMRIVDVWGSDMARLETADVCDLNFLGEDWFSNPGPDTMDDSNEYGSTRRNYERSAFCIVLDGKLTSLLPADALPEDKSLRSDLVRNAYPRWSKTKTQDNYEHWLRHCNSVLRLDIPDLMAPSQIGSSGPVQVAATFKKMNVKAVIESALSMEDQNDQQFEESRSILVKAIRIWRPGTAPLVDKDLVDIGAAIARLGLSELRESVGRILSAHESIWMIYLSITRLQKFYKEYADGATHCYDRDSGPTEPPPLVTSIEKLSYWTGTLLREQINQLNFEQSSVPEDLVRILISCKDDVREAVVQACLHSIQRPVLGIRSTFNVFKCFALRLRSGHGASSVIDGTFQILLGKLQQKPIEGVVLKDIVDDLFLRDGKYLTKFVHGLLHTPSLHRADGSSSRCLPVIASLAPKTGDGKKGREVNILVTIILAAYLVLDIGAAPQPMSLVRPGIQCLPECQICVNLNQFLGSDSQRAWRAPPHWSQVHDQHILRQISTIWDHPYLLAQSSRFLPGNSAMCLCLEKIDQRWPTAHKSWLQRRQQYQNALDTVVKVHSEAGRRRVLGHVYETLATLDVPKAMACMRDASYQTLSRYHFIMPDNATEFTKVTMKAAIEERSGVIWTATQFASGEYIPGRTIISITPDSANTTDKVAELPVLEDSGMHGSDDTKARQMPECELPTFLDDCFSKALKERLHPEIVGSTSADSLSPRSCSEDKQSQSTETTSAPMLCIGLEPAEELPSRDRTLPDLQGSNLSYSTLTFVESQPCISTECAPQRSTLSFSTLTCTGQEPGSDLASLLKPSNLSYSAITHIGSVPVRGSTPLQPSSSLTFSKLTCIESRPIEQRALALPEAGRSDCAWLPQRDSGSPNLGLHHASALPAKSSFHPLMASASFGVLRPVKSNTQDSQYSATVDPLWPSQSSKAQTNRFFADTSIQWLSQTPKSCPHKFDRALCQKCWNRPIDASNSLKRKSSEISAASTKMDDTIVVRTPQTEGTTKTATPTWLTVPTKLSPVVNGALRERSLNAPKIAVSGQKEGRIFGEESRATPATAPRLKLTMSSRHVRSEIEVENEAEELPRVIADANSAYRPKAGVFAEGSDKKRKRTKGHNWTRGKASRGSKKWWARAARSGTFTARETKSEEKPVGVTEEPPRSPGWLDQTAEPAHNDRLGSESESSLSIPDSLGWLQSDAEDETTIAINNDEISMSTQATRTQQELEEEQEQERRALMDTWRRTGPKPDRVKWPDWECYDDTIDLKKGLRSGRKYGEDGREQDDHGSLAEEDLEHGEEDGEVEVIEIL